MAGDCADDDLLRFKRSLLRDFESNREVCSGLVKNLLKNGIDKLPLAKQAYLYDSFKEDMEEMDRNGFPPTPEEIEILNAIKSRGLINVEKALKASEQRESSKKEAEDRNRETRE